MSNVKVTPYFSPKVERGLASPAECLASSPFMGDLLLDRPEMGYTEGLCYVASMTFSGGLLFGGFDADCLDGRFAGL